MPDEYVIVEKSTLDSIGDTVRSATGSTENISVNNLNDAVAAAITSGGVLIDSSLTQSGYAADAKATGDAIRSLSEEKVEKTGISLGRHTDGLIYIFVDGVPIGSGMDLSGGTDVGGDHDVELVPYETITWNATAASIGLNTSRYQCWAPHNMQVLGDYIYYLQCHRSSHSGAFATWTLVRFKPENVFEHEEIKIPEFAGVGALLIEGGTIYLYTRTGIRYKSDDYGATWNAEATNLGSASAQVNLYGIYKAGDYYYAGNDGGTGEEGLFWYSTDGLNWNEKRVEEITWSDTEMVFCHFGGHYLGFARDNSDVASGYAVVITSEDGLNWTIDADSVIRIPSAKSNISIAQFDDALAFGSTDRDNYELWYSVYKTDGTFTTQSLGTRGNGFDFHAPNICFSKGVVVFTYSTMPDGTAYGSQYNLAHNVALIGTYENVSAAHYEIETLTQDISSTPEWNMATRGLNTILPDGVTWSIKGFYWVPSAVPATLYASVPDFSIVCDANSRSNWPTGFYKNGYGVNFAYADLTIANLNMLAQKAIVDGKYFTVSIKHNTMFAMDKLVVMEKTDVAQMAEGTYFPDELMYCAHIASGTQKNMKVSTLYKCKFVDAVQ